MSLNKEMEQLIDSVRQPILIFIPKEIFNEPSKINPHLFKSELVGTAYLLTKENKVITYIEGVEDFKIIQKPKLLETNVFQLLQWKSKLEKDAFEYFLTKYIREVNEWKDASKWMALRAKENIVKWSETLQATLNFQYDCLDEHHKKVLNTFSSSETKDPKSELEVSINQRQIKNKIVRGNTPQTKDKSKNLIITEKEADKFLLKNVFNIDL